jgi:hypothetical protein
VRLAAAALALMSAGAVAQTWHGPAVPEKTTVIGNSDHVRLGHAIAVKLANPDFAAVRNQRGRLPPPSFDMAEEQPVREARDRLAAARQAPADAKVLVIPRAVAAPQLDGIVNAAEWRGALRIPLEPQNKKATVLLFIHGGTLYLAALAPGDRTPGGFDQFRFWYHVDLSPFFENERAMIAGRGQAGATTRDALTLRGVRLPRPGEPIRDGLDAKALRRDVDWGVHGKLRAASTITGFRQYEAAIDLAEAGLGAKAPFAAYIEIEGDPQMDGGKFKSRVHEGEIGSQARPIWLRLTP